MASLTSCFRLKNSWERRDRLSYHRELIKILGHERWAEDEEIRFQLHLKFFDEETMVLEQGGMSEMDLSKRRQLLVQLSTEHNNFMAIVFNHHFEYLTT
jgi:hypothetical protein